MSKTPTARRLDASRRIARLEIVLGDAAEYVRRNIRNIIECGTRDYDLTTASKETRAAIDQDNELLRRIYAALHGTTDPAGVCMFCRCTEQDACTCPDGEPCAWLRPYVCTNPACVKAIHRAEGNTHRLKG